MAVSERIEIKNLSTTDHDFTLTLTVDEMEDDTESPWTKGIQLKNHNVSPWTKGIQLKNHNVKFRFYRYNHYFTLECFVETFTRDIGKDKLLITAEHDVWHAQRYINVYNTVVKVVVFEYLSGKDVKIMASTVSQSSPGPFGTMYNDDILLDFKLVVKGSTEVTEENSVGFHRTVLAAWSPVMMGMFSNSCKEKNEGVLELPVDLDLIKALKKYVYTEELPEDRETLLGLVELGSYFMNPKLETCASERMLKLIAPNEIWETIEHSVIKKTYKLSKSLLTKVNNADKDEFEKIIDEIPKLP